MRTIWPFSVPRCKPALQRVVAGRILTGILIDDGNLLLRFVDAMLIVDLSKRICRFQSVLANWMILPGWLRVVRVIEDQNQIIMVVSGALYTAHIIVRKVGGEWNIVLQGGRILASN